MTEDYLQRFGGIGRLYGRAGLQRLHDAHVCIVGLGGVGSWTVESLARTGLGALTLIDLDDLCITNVNRQLPAVDGQIGRPKADALAKRVRLINPACRVTAVPEFFTASTADALLGPKQRAGGSEQGEIATASPLSAPCPLSPAFSFVVDAIDKLTNKCLLLTACRDRGLPVLTIGGAGGKRDGTQVRVRDLGATEQDELLRQLRRALRRDYGFGAGIHGARPSLQPDFGIPAVFSPEKPTYPLPDGTCSVERPPGPAGALDCASGFGSACHVTAAFGLAAAGEVVRRIALG